MGGAGAAGAVTSRCLHNNLQQTSVECSTLDTAEDMTQSAVKVSTRFRETYIIFAPYFVVEQSHSEFPLQCVWGRGSGQYCEDYYYRESFVL